MSSQLTPRFTTVRTPAERAAVLPSLAAARRAVVRMQAARVADRMIRELIAGPQPAAGREPLFVRLDALRERYAALGGDPTDLPR